jgi:hypothetical protein
MKVAPITHHQKATAKREDKMRMVSSHRIAATTTPARGKSYTVVWTWERVLSGPARSIKGNQNDTVSRRNLETLGNVQRALGFLKFTASSMCIVLG